MVKIFGDGGSANEHGGFKVNENTVGGWAYIIISSKNGKNEILKKDSGSELGATNNKMELAAIIEGLESFKKLKLSEKEIEVYSDSMYIIKGITNWINAWTRNNWKSKKDEPIKNMEYWKHLQALDIEFKPKWLWVKGHDGDEYNEQCDLMVQDVIRKKKDSMKK
jgi:ribonuclease HI